VEQLADPGIMAVPVGTQGLQQLRIITRRDGAVSEREGGGCVFVPLVGREGWSEET
jgi:protein-L-isoaspartate(D-aspartate) O-methyltransferase